MCGYFEQLAQSRHGPRGDNIERSLNAFDFATDYLGIERKRFDGPVEKVRTESPRLYQRYRAIHEAREDDSGETGSRSDVSP